MAIARRNVNIGPTGRKIVAILDRYPGSHAGLYLTSGYRPGDPGHHGGLSYRGSPTAAVDIGFGYGTSGYQARARGLAAWLYQHSRYHVELIVSRVGSPHTNGGYYVKNTARVGPYAHTGSNPSVRHENHIHDAMSSALADAMSKAIGSSPAPPSQPSGPAQATVSVMPYGQRPTIRRGDSGGATGHAQFLLRNRLGYKIDNVAGSPFGPQTESAVRAFQQRHGLTVDSIVGPKTWPELEVKAAQAISVGNRPMLRRDSKGMWVGYAQHVLREAGHNVDEVQGFPFGPQTERAVTAFQAAYGLTDDAIVGPKTYAALDAAESGQAPPAPPPPAPPKADPPPQNGPDYSAPDSFVPREEWNAHDAKSFQEVELSHWEGITVHHSGGGYTTPKNIQEWMMFNRPEAERLADVGYTLLIYNGKVHVGRGLHVRPAHDGINKTVGICVIGNYSTRLPSQADLEALALAIQEVRAYVGRDLPVDAHRNRGQTDCPGDELYEWMANDLPSFLDDDPAEEAGGENEEKPETPECDCPSLGELLYVVKSGDTLAAIASRYRVKAAGIIAANNIPDPNHIEVGQHLALPK